MKWAITADELVQLRRDLIPNLEVLHSGPRARVTSNEKKSEFKRDNQRKDLLVLKKPDPAFDASFRIYTDANALKKDLKTLAHLWYEYTFPDELGDDAKHRYEIFCGGWLHYYDMEVRNGDIEHVISFDWSVPKAVKVYISPKYRKEGINVYLHMYPPGAGDPPTPKHPPPY